MYSTMVTCPGGSAFFFEFAVLNDGYVYPTMVTCPVAALFF